MTVRAWHASESDLDDAGPAADGDNPYLAVLASVLDELGTLGGPADQAFQTIGSALGEASSILTEVQGSFGTVIEKLDGHSATPIAEGLRKATGQIATLAAGSHGDTEMLTRLGDMVRRIDGRLTALTKIVGEVDSLAINAKIQASLIASGGIDFTVFTSEMQRLGFLANQTIERTAVRLRSLDLAIRDGLAAMQDFGLEAAEELAGVQEKLVDGITVMADQHRAATDAVQRMGLHSRDTAERVVACMTELQFNDTACQRIEHVRTAMTIVTDLARSGDEQQIDALVGAVCRLQALHLTRTAVEYRERVEALAVHLREIAKDANKICAEAEAATSVETHQGGDAGQDSFIGSIKRNMMVGAELLNRQKSGQESVEVAVRSVSTGFAEMAIDLDAIQSIDSDMRVMGLNATFKCSRLGNQGRALGVIATELRSCSKRTEDCSGQISELLKNAIAMSRALEDREDAGDAATVSELIDWMTNSSIDLGAIIVWLDETLARLSRDSQRAASLLQETADRIVVHHRMNEALTAAAAKLESVADMTGIDGNDIVIMGERIRALLAGHYTMQSERLIHQIFADCFSGEPAVASIAAPAAADATIDDLLF